MGLDLWHVRPSGNILVPYVDYFTLDELDNPNYTEQNRAFITLVEDDKGMLTPAIYFTELGYQRKGMSIRFTNEFRNCTPYFTSESVRKALQFIQGDDLYHEHQLKENFQKYFIDTFIEGSSVFFASW